MYKPLLLSIAYCLMIVGASADGLSQNVDENGSITLPDDFRKNMAHLGSWFVPEGDASGFHDVYTEQSSIDAFRETGKFPDGATLVKELRASTTGTYTTGKDVSYANDKVKQIFVMVKDSRNRFSNNPVWGEGWGWALFKPDQSGANLTTNYQTECLGCHVPAKKSDWIYIEAYPSLSTQ